jgi:O-antigen ligase
MRSGLRRNDPASAEQKWSRLAMIWSIYYFAAWTLGQDARFMQKVIWLGAAGVGLFTVPLFAKYIRFKDLPREGVLLGLFILWALTGLFVVTDVGLFTYYLKLLTELMLIVLAVSVILKYSGAAKWFYLAFWGVGVVRVLYGSEPVSMERITGTETVSRIDYANTIGFLCTLGILGLFAFWGETKKLWWRAALVAGGAFALYGVVLSASRGAFVTLIAIVLLWPAMCLVGASKSKLKALVGAIVLLYFAYEVYQFIVQETYMGVRYTNATRMEDGSTQTRYDLAMTGFRLFAENPIFGCGLGQFGIAAGTGLYAHNEVAEIAGTLGLPGLVLYYSVYWIAWRRLTRSLRYLQDPLIRYRINIARMSLLILLLSGALTRPNFFAQNTMFLLGMAVGMAHWAERMARRACAQPMPAWPYGAPPAAALGPPPGWGAPVAPPPSIAVFPPNPYTG